MTNKLFVGSLSWNATEQMLQDLFATVGTVQSVHIIMDKYSGKSKGFGFVEMSTPEEAEKAIQQLNGSQVDGRAINISAALPQEPRNNAGGGGSRYGSGGGNNSRGGFRNDRNDRGGRGGGRY
ncbi:MAG TPA: RNA-binding protein [Candidatus Saccharimonadales bacterium]|nr:RNA-binding protein [Candidatus Saccharimonadales bacterium]